MDNDITVDVVIVWKKIGTLKVLTVLCRMEQFVEYTMFPEQAGITFDREVPDKMIFGPLRNRFAATQSTMGFRDDFVDYIVWENTFPPHHIETYRFHIVDARGLKISLREKVLEETGRRTFETPDWVEVDQLLAKKDGGELRLKHPHYLALRRLRYLLYEQASEEVSLEAPV